MKGRVAIYEVMPVGEHLRDLILQHAPTAAIRDLALRQGMKTLRQNGIGTDPAARHHPGRGAPGHDRVGADITDPRPARTDSRGRGDRMTATLHDLLTTMIEREASDLHLTAGTFPQIRLHGRLTPLTGFEVLTPPDTERLATASSTRASGRRSRKTASSTCPSASRASPASGATSTASGGRSPRRSASSRASPRSFEELGLPPILAELAERPQGLVLVTGPTGSGKSTTLAAMIDKINSERAQHIMTIEDPIEFVHPHKRGVVNQREVRSRHPVVPERAQVHPAPGPGRRAHRRDARPRDDRGRPDHRRDRSPHPRHPPHQLRACRPSTGSSTSSRRTSRARCGRSCRWCWKASSPSSSSRRPTAAGAPCPRRSWSPTPAIRNLIREEKIHQIYSIMQAGHKHGMQTMNQSLADLVHRRQIARERRSRRAHGPRSSSRLLSSSARARGRRVPSPAGRPSVAADGPGGSPCAGSRTGAAGPGAA